MRVRHDDEIKHRRRDRQLLIYEKVLALLHSAVNNALFISDFYQRTASGDFVRRT